MAETHVVSGLAAKRSELTGLILDYQKKIDQMRVAVGHLDASIKLFSPDYDLRSVRAKATRQRYQYFRPGECQRLVLETFRDADGNMLSSRQIGEALVQRKELASSAEMVEQMQKNAIAVAKRLEETGILIPAGMNGAGRTWRLA